MHRGSALGMTRRGPQSFYHAVAPAAASLSGNWGQRLRRFDRAPLPGPPPRDSEARLQPLRRIKVCVPGIAAISPIMLTPSSRFRWLQAYAALAPPGGTAAAIAQTQPGGVLLRRWDDPVMGAGGRVGANLHSVNQGA